MVVRCSCETLEIRKSSARSWWQLSQRCETRSVRYKEPGLQIGLNKVNGRTLLTVKRETMVVRGGDSHLKAFCHFETPPICLKAEKKELVKKLMTQWPVFLWWEKGRNIYGITKHTIPSLLKPIKTPSSKRSPIPQWEGIHPLPHPALEGTASLVGSLLHPGEESCVQPPSSSMMTCVDLTPSIMFPSSPAHFTAQSMCLENPRLDERRGEWINKRMHKSHILFLREGNTLQREALHQIKNKTNVEGNR